MGFSEGAADAVKESPTVVFFKLPSLICCSAKGKVTGYLQAAAAAPKWTVSALA